MKRFTFSTDRLYIAKVLSIALTLAFSSCQKAEDIIGSLDKISYQSYLRNESGQGVTVVMRPSRHSIPTDCSWYIPKDSVVEIPGTEHMDRAYHQKKYHFVRSLWGMLIGLIPCLLGAALYTLFI